MDTPPRSGSRAQVPRPSLPQKPRGISKVFPIPAIGFFLFLTVLILSVANKTEAEEIDFPKNLTAREVSYTQIDLVWESGGAEPTDRFRLSRSVAGGGRTMIAKTV